MVDRNELQNKARLVESHRQHLDELERRMEQIVNVINEHQITEEILSRLVTLSSNEQAKAERDREAARAKRKMHKKSKRSRNRETEVLLDQLRKLVESESEDGSSEE